MRCAFRLCDEGLELVEVSSAVDGERDSLARMDLRPVIIGTPRLMEPAIDHAASIGLLEWLLQIPLSRRFTFDAKQILFFIN